MGYMVSLGSLAPPLLLSFLKAGVGGGRDILEDLIGKMHLQFFRFPSGLLAQASGKTCLAPHSQ